MAIEDLGVSRATEGLRCPTCGAKQGWTDTCRRCKSDLRLLRVALDAYERNCRSSLQELDTGFLETALRHAARCHELWPGPESHRLMAVCQLLRGDCLQAIDLARAVEEPGTETVR